MTSHIIQAQGLSTKKIASYVVLSLALALPVASCSGTDAKTESPKTEISTDQNPSPEPQSTADISTAISGTYIGDPSHTYVGLTYMHQGYARATLRVDNVQIDLNLDSAAPESASLNVMMKSENVSTGTQKFDDHLMSADFFDAGTYPDITFKSTFMKMLTPASGTVTGTLTIKDISKPVTLKVRLNKVGQSFQSKADMIGISASGEISRTDWGLGKYAPVVGDMVTLTIESEMAIPKQ